MGKNSYVGGYAVGACSTRSSPFKEEKKYTCRRPHRPDATVWREATARSVYQNECQCLHPLSSFLSFVMHTQPVSPFLQRTLNCLYFFYLFFQKKTSFRTITASAILFSSRRTMYVSKNKECINLDMLIWLSESSLSGLFSEVLLIRDNQGRETVWLSNIKGFDNQVMKSLIINGFHHVSPKFSNYPDDSPDQTLIWIKI